MDEFAASHDPLLYAEHAGQEFRIVIDDCVGCFLYVSQDGELLHSELRSIPEEIRDLALAKFGVPKSAWQVG